ncbi:MAG: tRNA (cytidine(34)-2'-O)-methyltransferase [Prochlorotrichaceae cyanobacterium]|jgi:tRNA (cytidine/uridine-2'-O-)-methyltransferase
MVSVVLFQPQIPPNTGNIARTCAATQTPLHLIGPLGFEISDRYLKRAGLDYWPAVDLHQHLSWEDFQQTFTPILNTRLIGFTTRGEHNYTHFTFQPSDRLLFGRETSGLPESVLQACTETVFIPIDYSQVRSLNLSVSVAVALFEARRQLGLLNGGAKVC